ncbi:MAG: DUF814 domain-containing protein [Deltaproteobacteria bacterium]|nr:DUF814 domain-containing protein [Deltaproteobacteria bacterium]
MSFSTSEINVVTDTLNHALSNTLVRKVISPAAGNRICLELRGPGKNHYLQICVAHSFCSIGRVEQKPKAAEVPVAFVMLLRKMCINCAVTRVAQLNNDRIVSITLTRNNVDLVLLCELAGRHANLFLLDTNGVILGMLHANQSHRRHLIAKEPYQLPASPPPQTKQNSRVESGDGADIKLMTLYAQIERDAVISQKRIAANRAVTALLKKQKALVENLTRDQQKAAQADNLKSDAYIVQANLQKIARGTKRFDTTDFEGNPISITLNPILSAVENMQAMFEKAGRLGRATAKIDERLQNAMIEEENLESIKREIVDAPPDALDDLLGRLSQINRQVVQRARKRTQTPVRLPYRQYPIFGAHTARVGKSSKDNDALTLRHATPNDLWLHVRGVPGSHVVVPLGRGEDPTPDLLVDAAHLAAHFSSARNDDHVEIIYTRRKYVQKPKGAAPGSVRLLKEKTFVLKVEPNRLRQLLSDQWSGQSNSAEGKKKT